ncbi:MAG: hypothetical protein Q8J74_08585 [Candidatus Didemnitutus sp.]|nr:hypothetical protein [Candidatus Didemnitutus sp.]
MKLGRILLAGLLATLLAAPAVFAQDVAGKKKLAVTKITANPAVAQRMAAQGVGLSLDTIVQGLEAQVHDRLLNTRRFEMLERADVDALATESAAAGETFAFNKADYILTIRVDGFNDRVETRRLASLGKTISARAIEISAVAKVTEVATQRSIASANFSVLKRDSENRSENTIQRVGEATDELMMQAVRELAQKISGRATDAVFPARIIGMRDRIVTINRNDQAGVAVGQIWEVFAIGEELVDPDTGEKSREEVFVGKIRVTRVTPQNSQAEIIEDMGIDNRAIVRLLEDAPEEM